jgi:hypothetical protein
MSLDLPYLHAGPDRLPVGKGTFQVTDLRWDDQDLGDTLRGEVRVGPDGLELGNVAGTLGQGLFRADLRLPGRQRPSGFMSFSLTQAEASRVLRPWPAVDGHVEGPIDASLRARIDPDWHGGGSLVLTRGKVFGVEVVEWRIPLRFAFSPRELQGEVVISDTTAVVALGRVLGRASLSWGAEGRLGGEVRFFDVDLRTLVQSSGDFGSIASGKLTGRIELGGADVRSADDVTATLTADLSQAQALQLPVLRQLVPFLRSGASSTFQTGHVEARLAHGLVRVQRLTLQGGLLNMIVEGTVTLEGRLNLEVTARTGSVFLAPSALRLLGLRIPAAGVLPASLILEASLLLANSVVHLRVTGSVRNPVVQVEPVRLLTEEAVRYFLSRALFPGP